MIVLLHKYCQILGKPVPLRNRGHQMYYNFGATVTSPPQSPRSRQSMSDTGVHQYRYHHLLCKHAAVSLIPKRIAPIPTKHTMRSRSFLYNSSSSSSSITTSVRTTTTTTIHDRKTTLEKVVGVSLQGSAGYLQDQPSITSIQNTVVHQSINESPPLVDVDIPHPKRVLVLCTGGTMTMVPDTMNNNALTPQQGALSYYIKNHMVPELYYKYGNHAMPEIVLHEYTPFLDSSDLGPDEFANVAHDIYINYNYFDGFVVVTGTDTMSYFATSLSFMFENLNKPIVFTGSQIPLCYPYNDARHNLIMAILFASRGGNIHESHEGVIQSPSNTTSMPIIPAINEVTIFFHDRLLRANRSTKVNTHQLMAFDSPNMKPLATIGISIQDNIELFLRTTHTTNHVPVQLHTNFDTRVLTLRLIPGFDDAMIRHMIERNITEQLLKGLVLQLYGTGNMPSVKKSFIDLLSYAKHQCGIVIVATTQCMTGSVQFGNYAVGTVMEQQAGVVSAYDMTMEATVCKLAYLLGRSDTYTTQQVESLMSTSLRGEITNQSLSSTRLK